MDDPFARLPRGPTDPLMAPLARFLRIEALAGAALLLCAVIALGLANSPLAGSYHALWVQPVGLRVGDIEWTRPLRTVINDGLMTLFFFVITLELKRGLLLGELRDRRVAVLPIVAAVGGMLVPAALFLLLESGGAGASGWGVVMATDTAFVLGCLGLLGNRAPPPLRLFLLALAIVDDIGAMLVLIVGYGTPPAAGPLALAALGLLIVVGLRVSGIRSVGCYVWLGMGIWLALDTAGLRPTAAGLILGLMTPSRSWVSDRRLRAILGRIVTTPPGDRWSGDTAERRDLQRAGTAAREALSPLERLEMGLHPWVAFIILPLFTLANAGVTVTGDAWTDGPGTSVFIALFLGKPAGILLFGVSAVVFGLATLPPGLSWRLLAAASPLTGIGFTMGFLIAPLGFDPALVDTAKLGILTAGAASAALALAALAWVTAGASPADAETLPPERPIAVPGSEPPVDHSAAPTGRRPWASIRSTPP
ncbi:MAG: hypothetical protein RLY86_603 [Pseudomonadota bacterium]|jgi:NhaA family Na+:H+ antiporter